MSGEHVSLAGVPLRNRVIVSAGCHGASGEMIVATGRQGVGAVTTKTIVAQAVADVRPCFTAIDGGFLNCVFGTTLPAEQWFSEELPRAKDAEVPVIASLAGLSAQESADLAKRAVAAGADIVEIPTVCPHMGEILEAMFPGLTMPPPEVHDVGSYVETVKAVKDAVHVPVMAKFSALFHANVIDWAVAVEEAGADAIACADAFGPGLKIDVETGEPALGGPRGVGGLTGPALKPIALRMILEMAERVSIPLVGVGGISRAEDAIEYFMAGASFVGVVTAGHLKGARRFQRIVDGIDRWVADHGYRDVSDFVGLTLRRIEARRDEGKVAITTPQPPIVDPELCSGCRRCEVSCVYDAIHVGEDGVALPDEAACYGCGLCASVCPTAAIRFTYFG